jgi:hypothetical protein
MQARDIDGAELYRAAFETAELETAELDRCLAEQRLLARVIELARAEPDDTVSLALLDAVLLGRLPGR